MFEQPRAAASTGARTRAPQDFHCVDLDRVSSDLSAHLNHALHADVPLVVTVDGEPQIRLETVEDLEVIHEAASARDTVKATPPTGQR